MPAPSLLRAPRAGVELGAGNHRDAASYCGGACVEEAAHDGELAHGSAGGVGGVAGVAGFGGREGIAERKAVSTGEEDACVFACVEGGGVERSGGAFPCPHPFPPAPQDLFVFLPGANALHCPSLHLEGGGASRLASCACGYPDPSLRRS